MNMAFNAKAVRHAAVKPAGGTSFEHVITRSDFATAIAEITQWRGYSPTPLHSLTDLAETLDLGDILYKDEGPRFGLASFKALGGAYAGLRVLQLQLSRSLGRDVGMDEIRNGDLAEAAAQITLVSATDGNHGRSLAWGARLFGAQCRIYIHKDVSEGRADAMRALGATVIVVDGDYDESLRVTREQAEENGWFVVSDTSWEGYFEPPRDVMSGYAVMTREITDVLVTPPSHVFLQGGVGGMAASVAAALRQTFGDESPRVVIVEPELAPCLYRSALNGHVTAVQIDEETVMAGLSCGVPSDLAWQILREEASDFITIPDAMVAPAMRLLAKPRGDDPAIEAGESAVAGLAAVMAAATDPVLREALALTSQSLVLLIGSEGVTDPEIFERIMAGSER